MPNSVRAIRGATTVDIDEAKQITDRVQELVTEMFASNGVEQEDVISIFFTATADISSIYPATAARQLGLDEVPLMGAQELTVEGMTPRCIRIMAHVNTSLDRSQISHVYHYDARTLRTDLVK